MSARRLTVVQALPRLESGGVERGAVEVCEELTRRGHRAVVVSAGGPMVAEVQAVGGAHVEMPVAKKSPLTLTSVRPFRRLLRDLDAHIVHARSRVPAWVAYLAWKKMSPGNRPRFVTTLHGLNSVNRYSEIMTKGERVIAVSQSAERHLLRHYPRLDPSRVTVIHRGVDPSEFPHGHRPAQSWLHAWHDEFPALRGARTLTTIGRLTRLKGHHAFIDLIASLSKQFDDLRGVIVGSEDPRRRAYAQELRARIEREGLSDRIVMTGHRADVREIASVSDAVCCLSAKPESFGRTALEALRLGTPVLGWDHGGVGEILGTVSPEGAVPLNDDAELLRRAEALLSHEKTLVPKSEAFTKRSMLEAIVDLYESMAGERHA